MDTYVTDKDGTGIVHQAPAFGEDDHRIALAYEVINADEMPPCPVDDAGRFTSEVPDFVGQYVKVKMSRHYLGCGLTLYLILPGRRQGDYESAQSKGPTCETRTRKASISILLEVRMTAWMADFYHAPDCRSPQVKYSHHLPRISGMEREGDTHHRRPCGKQCRD